MGDYIMLLGADDVQRAGSAMRIAAEEMSRAAMNFDAAIYRLARILEDHAERIERAMGEKTS